MKETEHINQAIKELLINLLPGSLCIILVMLTWGFILKQLPLY